MRITPFYSKPPRVVAAKPAAAFTLPELLVSVTVMMILVGGIVAANIFGLKMFQTTSTILGNTDSVRKAMGKMTDEIRVCRTTWVGDVTTNGTFVARIDGELQRGSAIMINPTTNLAVFTIYFVNPSDRSFRRATSAGSTTLLARQVTNDLIFSAQDHLGKVLTNSQNNRVIHLNLDLFQPKRYGTIASHYRLETSVTRRALL